MKKLTFKGFSPVDLQSGLNIITIENTKYFFKILQTIIGNDDEIILSEDNHIMKLDKSIVYIGDPTSDFSVQKFYEKQIFDMLMVNLDDNALQALYDMDNKIKQILWDDLIDNNLPFFVDDRYDALKLLKTQNLNIELTQYTNFFDKISSILTIMAQMSESRIIILTNIYMYLSNDEIQQIQKVLLAEELIVIVLELGEKLRSVADIGANGWFIDDDFVFFGNQIK